MHCRISLHTHKSPMKSWKEGYRSFKTPCTPLHSSLPYHAAHPAVVVVTTCHSHLTPPHLIPREHITLFLPSRFVLPGQRWKIPSREAASDFLATPSASCGQKCQKSLREKLKKRKLYSSLFFANGSLIMFATNAKVREENSQFLS